jgi:hypothetical protein
MLNAESRSLRSEGLRYGYGKQFKVTNSNQHSRSFNNGDVRHVKELCNGHNTPQKTLMHSLGAMSTFDVSCCWLTDPPAAQTTAVA